MEPLKKRGAMSASIETVERKPTVRKAERATANTAQSIVRYELQALRLLLTGVVVAVLAPAAYVWRNHQVVKNAGAILDRGEAFAEKEKWGDAAAAYHQYLQLQPDDPDVSVHLAEAVAETALTQAQKGRAVELHFRAVRLAPEHVDTRRRLAELLVATERYTDAEQQAKWLLARNENDLTSLRLLAVSQLRQLGTNARLSPADVAKTYLAGLEKHPGDLELSMALAELYREHPEAAPGATPMRAAEAADKIIHEMVAANTEDYKAHLLRYRYRTQNGLSGAEDDLQAAMRLAPDVPDVLLSAIYHASRTGQSQTALGYCEKLLAAAPADRRGYLVQGQTHLRLGDRQRALDAWRTGLKVVGGDDFDFNRAILGVQLEDGQTTEAERTLHTLEDNLRKHGPFLTAITRRRLLEDLEVFRAQLLLAKGDARTAVPLLKRIAAGHTQDANVELDAALREQQWTLLAQAHARLMRPDLAAEAAQEAVKANPKSTAARLFAAAACLRVGQTEAAIQHYTALMVGENPPREAVVALASLYLHRESALPEGARDWRAVEGHIEHAKTLLGQDPALQLIEAQVAFARGNSDAGAAILDTLATSPSADAKSLVSVALLYEALGKASDADRAVERLATVQDDDSQSVLLRAELLTRRREYDQAREILEQIQDQVPLNSRTAVMQRLAAFDLERGRPDLARQRLKELSKSRSNDLSLLDSVANLAYQAGDLNELESCERRLREVEGPGGTLWKYFQGLRLVATATSAADEGLATAEQLQAEIQTSRPTWPAAFLLGGKIADRRGRTEEAATNYEEAIRLGNRSITTIEFLISSLYRLQRFAEAGRYIERIGEFVAYSPLLTDMAIPGYLRSGKFDKAIEIAQIAVRSRPNDPAAHVRLGQALALNGQLSDAEAEFKRARELAPNDLRIRAGLVWFLGRAGRIDEARTEIETLTVGIHLRPEQAELALAQAYEMIADRTNAEQHYLAAAAATPDNPDLHARLGRFYLQADPHKAEKELRRVLELAPQARDARRILATLIAARGGEAEMDEALSMLRETNAAEVDGSQDRRVEASLLAIRGGDQNRKAAAAMLTELIDSNANPLPSDRLLLARIQEADGNLAAAQSQLQALVAADSPPPAYVAAYVEFLLRQSKMDEAEPWLTRLDETEPEGINRISLRAKLLQLQARDGEIEPFVEAALQARLAAAKSDAERGRTLQEMAGVYEQLGRSDQAERCLRKLRDTVPQGYLTLVRWLSDKGRQTEAIRVCQAAAQQDPSPQPAAALAQVLTIGAGKSELDPSLQSQADQLLADAIKANPGHRQLLFCVATLRYMQGRADESIALYQQILQFAPSNAATLNNLAVVLSEESGRTKEAIACIERAIAAAGPSAELLDSQALVLLNSGMAADARRLLEQLVRNWPHNARYRFHLALAAHKTGGDLQTVRDSLKVATDNGLANQYLSPRERQQLAQLEQDLNLTTSGAAAAARQ